jgi:hypothetical protein
LNFLSSASWAVELERQCRLALSASSRANARHSGVDGKAGIEIAKVFHDVTPQAREVRPPRPRVRATPTSSA